MGHCTFEDCCTIVTNAPLIRTQCVTSGGWETGPVGSGFVGGDLLIEGCNFVRPRAPVLDLQCGKNIVFRGNSIDMNGVDMSKCPDAGALKVAPCVIGFKELRTKTVGMCTGKNRIKGAAGSDPICGLRAAELIDSAMKGEER